MSDTDLQPCSCHRHHIWPILGAHFSCRGAMLGLRASGWAGQEFTQQELVIFREVWDHGTQQLHIKCWQ